MGYRAVVRCLDFPWPAKFELYHFLFFSFRNVIVTEYEGPQNHVVLKATIFNLGESGSSEGASLYIRHDDHGDDGDEVSISSTFYEQPLSVQIPKAQINTIKLSVFLGFQDLRVQKLQVEC